MAESNVRPLAIFTSYMIACSALTARCISLLIRRPSTTSTSHHAPAHKILIFSSLAALSLATTWYHMFCYFRWSYLDWATLHNLAGPDDPLLLGRWLRDTSLFKQAWASTLETADRTWWSLQIFGFCAVWSVMLAVQARKRNIPYAWAFMLLGQIVAISFASNLFFLAVLLYDVSPPSQPATRGSNSGIWHLFILGANVSLALIIPDQFGQPGFLKLLLAPHVLAFVPLLVESIAPARQQVGEPSWFIKIGVMAVIVGTASYKVITEHEQLSVIIETLHEHPAVSSVGWDVVCCWISYFAWYVFGRN
ncbi:hypothetical protein PT974_07789 [Cladobotryum mycophilum]|uniref:Uncharacterized protein n=1 Tax=Cladobotryum mycophilum TaxID=491253 RepID=A0ABR0SJ26_9HYPO